MKNISVMVLSLVLTFALSGCGLINSIKNVLRFGERQSFYYGATAKQWLPGIEEKAKEWHNDAYLYGISEAEVKPDGSSDKWQYLFYSPSVEKTLVYIYNSGFITTKEMVLPPLDPIRNFNIDSPSAIKLSAEKAQGFLQKTTRSIIVISLIGPPYESSKRNRSKWLVKYYGNTGALNVLIDATSGTVLN